MKDAFGGIFNLAIISVFLVVVMGTLGLTVNYIKAFRAKNIIVSTVEQYGAGQTCFRKGLTCFEKIKERLEGISYHPNSITCPADGTDGYKEWWPAPRDNGGQNEVLFCYSAQSVNDGHLPVAKKYGKNNQNNSYIFTVVTQVDIDIPIINKIMGLYFFQVKGDTRIIEPQDAIK